MCWGQLLSCGCSRFLCSAAAGPADGGVVLVPAALIQGRESSDAPVVVVAVMVTWIIWSRWMRRIRVLRRSREVCVSRCWLRRRSFCSTHFCWAHKHARFNVQLCCQSWCIWRSVHYRVRRKAIPTDFCRVFGPVGSGVRTLSWVRRFFSWASSSPPLSLQHHHNYPSWHQQHAIKELRPHGRSPVLCVTYDWMKFCGHVKFSLFKTFKT